MLASTGERLDPSFQFLATGNEVRVILCTKEIFARKNLNKSNKKL